MSYMWYTCFGAVVTIIIAIFTIPFYGWNESGSIDKTLIAPMIRKYFNDKKCDTNNTKLDTIIDESKL